MLKLFVLGLGLAIAIAACGPAAASMRCQKNDKGCRDMNAGTARAAKQTQHQIKSPRDAASGQATGKRTHKPIR